MASSRRIKIFLISLLSLPATSTSAINGNDKKYEVQRFALKQLVLFLNIFPEKYVLWIHSENSILKESIDGVALNLESIRLLVYLSYNRYHILPLETSFRFYQPIQIIFASYHVGKTEGIHENMLSYLLRPTTALILLGHADRTLLSSFQMQMEPRHILYPCIKFLLEIDEDGRLRYSLVCAGYCKETNLKGIPWSPPNMREVLENPLKTHRLYFREGNGVEASAIHVLKHPSYYPNSRFSSDDKYACSRLVPLRSKDVIYCDPFLMSIIYMGEAHNISFKIVSSSFSTAKHTFWWATQTIQGYKSIDMILIDLKLLGGARLSLTGEERFYYCRPEAGESYFDIDLWTSGYSIETWMVLLCTLGTLTVALAILNFGFVIDFHLLQELLNIVGILLRQHTSQSQQRRTGALYVGLAILAILITSLYENTITSSVTVKSVPPAIDKVENIP